MTPSTAPSRFHNRTRHATLDSNGQPSIKAYDLNGSGSSANCSGATDQNPPKQEQITMNPSAIPTSSKNVPEVPSINVRYQIRHYVDLTDEGLNSGFRNDSEGPLVVSLQEATNGKPQIELQIDTATSGSEETAWLTPEEAEAYAEAILKVARHAMGSTSMKVVR